MLGALKIDGKTEEETVAVTVALDVGVTEVGVAMAVSNVGAVVSTGIRMVGRLGLLTSNVWFLMGNVLLQDSTACNTMHIS